MVINKERRGKGKKDKIRISIGDCARKREGKKILDSSGEDKYSMTKTNLMSATNSTQKRHDSASGQSKYTP